MTDTDEHIGARTYVYISTYVSTYGMCMFTWGSGDRSCCPHHLCLMVDVTEEVLKPPWDDPPPFVAERLRLLRRAYSSGCVFEQYHACPITHTTVDGANPSL